MYKCFAIAFLFFRTLLLYGQRQFVFQWTNLCSANSQLVATHSYNFLAFSNECIRIENGLGIWKEFPSQGTFTYPCVQTREQLKLQLHLYPNPVTTIATIRASIYSDLERVVTLSIMDEVGRLLVQKKYTLYNLQQGVSVPVDYFMSGIYFLTVTGDAISGFKKFVKITK